MAGGRYGLLGRSLGHSFSSEIHALFGNPGYELVELEPSKLEGFFSGNDFGGVNVTIPYKRDVMRFCRLSPEAEAIGSVNTVVFSPEGKTGYNTDEYGFEYLAQRAGADFSGKKVAVLGSGGASKAVVYAAKKLGASEVKVISRTGEYNYKDLSSWRDSEIIVNATPVGMFPDCGASPVDLGLFPDCGAVLDLIYNPHKTALLLQAESMGIKRAGGLYMLTAQAKAAEELFFGKKIADSEIDRVYDTILSETENIVLIGMPGCGKTTVGKALGALTGREVVDTDELVERSAGKPIPEIFSSQGETAFRALEKKAVREAGKLTGKIIVTGGGVVEDPENLPPLRQNGVVFRITRDEKLLETAGRPLSESVGTKRLAERRESMYESFRDETAANDTTPEAAAKAVWERFLADAGTF